eukprot:ANDGO_07197.mRNA.1 hypothetical protein
MLQRAPVHGIGQMDDVEIATGTLDAATSVVVKCFPASNLAEWTTETGALEKLSKNDWSHHLFWVPLVLHSARSDYGALVCMAPVGVPLQLVLSYSNRALVFCTELLQQLTNITLQCHQHGVHHLNICPHNVVLLEEVHSDFQFLLCLIDWAGASFVQKLDKKVFHYHPPFSPEWLWLDWIETDEQRLQVCLQQAVFTVLYLAIGDVLSWLPPVAFYLKTSTRREAYASVDRVPDLFEIRERNARDVLDPLIPIRALDTDERKPLRFFLQQLHLEFSGLFEQGEKCSADPSLLSSLLAFCATHKAVAMQ